ncbi:MAG: glycosyltransferase [Azoarcus sp.]|nr:glycosyltransferase [Azoarcus sp.]
MSRLAVLVSFSGEGGVERMMLNLVEAIVARGIEVDLLAIRADSAHLAALPDGVRRIDLGVRHSLSSVRPLARYLRDERPEAMLIAKDRAIRAAVLARSLARVPCRIVGRLGTNLSAALEGRPALTRWLRTAPMRPLYAGVEHVVCVSAGVLDDTAALTRLPRSRLSVVPNPVVTPRLALLARATPEPPLPAGSGRFGMPLIVGAGRLTEQKDFATLIRAFALLRRTRPARLAILGDGRDRAALLALARSLDVADDLVLPGFLPNPWAWMARAQLFVLSSRWEGSPNVLTEALALGVPAVATDCPSGPRELLRDGAIGPLVSVGNAPELAAAMAATLDRPPPAHTLREAVTEHTAEVAAGRYLERLGLAPGKDRRSA